MSGADPQGAGAGLVLASASAARSRVLDGAGVTFAVEPAAVDEPALVASITADGRGAAEVAEALAELKASQVSTRREGAFVIGADQVLVCEGRLFAKPGTPDRARADLLALRGRSHELLSAVCVVRDGKPLWRYLARARMTMRPVSEAFVKHYLEAAGRDVLASVGAYQVEGIGVQLFSRIEGEHFAILGLPLLPLLEFLRGQGIVPA